MNHHIEVVYYNTDDGIWLHCSCGWETNAGFSPSPAQLVELAEAHSNRGVLEVIRESHS